MSNKLDRSQDFKRAIDLGLLGRLEPNDLIKVWDASAGAERAVSASGLVGEVLKAQTGYNASVAQYFTHDSSGNFLWVNI